MKKYFTLIIWWILFVSNVYASKAHVIILGTVHDLHKRPNYTEDNFRKILNFHSPDIILIEHPVDWYDENNVPNEQTLRYLTDPLYKDNGRDGQLGWAYCQFNSILCIPYDIIGRNYYFTQHNFFPRYELFSEERSLFFEEEIVSSRIQARVNDLYRLCENATPQEINSKLCDNITQIFEDTERDVHKEMVNRNFTKDPAFYNIFWDFWDNRNVVMANNICANAAKNPTKKILVLNGFRHRYSLIGLLKKCSQAILVPVYPPEDKQFR